MVILSFKESERSIIQKLSRLKNRATFMVCSTDSYTLRERIEGVKKRIVNPECKYKDII